MEKAEFNRIDRELTLYIFSKYIYINLGAIYYSLKAIFVNGIQ